MSCPGCIKGALHDGELTGKREVIAGVETYVSIPSGEYDPKIAVLFLGDIFGMYTNAKLICDSFANNGFPTYFPDYLQGDPVPIAEMNAGKFDMDSWRPRHGPAQVRASLDPIIKHLRDSGVTQIGATGYCFGGRYIAALAAENLIEAGAAAHPAAIVVPDDIEKILSLSKVPLLFNSCEFDHTWPKESQDKADELLKDVYAPGWKQVYHPGCRHGFAVRADLSVPEQKAGKERAFEETVAWFRKYLVR